MAISQAQEPNEAEAPAEYTEDALNAVMRAANADYSIYWRFVPPAREAEDDNAITTEQTMQATKGMLEFAQYCSMDGVLMGGSSTFAAPTHRGIMGGVWSSGEPYLLGPVGTADEARFDRKKLAMFERVLSIAFFKQGGGVLEVGSKKAWKELPTLSLADANAQAVALPRVEDEHLEHLARVLALTGAEYVLFYQLFDEVDELKGARYASQDGALMLKSRTFPLSPEVGIVGRAWARRERCFVLDASAADPRDFVRQPLAEFHGVRSIAFECFANGIIEYGTTQLWESAPTFSVGDLRADDAPPAITATAPAAEAAPDLAAAPAAAAEPAAMAARTVSVAAAPAAGAAPAAAVAATSGAVAAPAASEPAA